MSYKWKGMQKVNYKEALKLFDNGKKEVFLLYDDDTESAVEYDVNRIHEHYLHGGKFGYEK